MSTLTYFDNLAHCMINILKGGQRKTHQTNRWLTISNKVVTDISETGYSYVQQVFACSIHRAKI